MSNIFERSGLLSFLKKRYTEETTSVYLREITNFLANNPSAETYYYKDLMSYLGVLRKRYPNPKTLNRILAAIKVYYVFLCRQGTRKDNPAKNIHLKDKISRDIQLQDLFSIEELETLLTSKIERFNDLNTRNKVLISLLIYQALKPAEIENLELEDINLEQATIYIKATPKTNSRTLSLKANQILVFKSYIDETRIKFSLFSTENKTAFLLSNSGQAMQSEDITKHIKRHYGKLFAPRNLNCLTIRQSVITNLLKQNHDLRLVQVFAGHKTPSTTEKYKQADLEALKTAIKQYHPMK